MSPWLTGARAEVPWGPGLPEDIFLDAVLPHASVTEPRDSMRAEFHARYLPLVKGCKTPGQAALAINKKLFVDYKVGYNTRRLRTDQSSKESIAQGMATCTGLSIMLVEACRAVGVPARLAGIASWPGRGGNHTWVEVWDNGWHFVGAAEPDDKGLDHAWFVGDASTAIKGSWKNAIYAVTYRTTGDFFPLVWAPSAKMPGEDVTDRYSRGKPKPPTASRLMVEVRRGGDRVEADVTTVDRKTGTSRPVGTSLGPQVDINRHLTCEAPPGGSLFVVARHQGRAADPGRDGRRPWRHRRSHRPRPSSPGRHPEPSSPHPGRPLRHRRNQEGRGRQAPGRDPLGRLAARPRVGGIQSVARRTNRSAASLRRRPSRPTTARAPTSGGMSGRSPPTAGAWSSRCTAAATRRLHLNDQQWRAMFKRYKDHPEAGGYVYLSLRAPNDTWNGFYDDAICPLVERLIRQFVVSGRRQPGQGLYAGRLARRLRSLRDRPQDARPVRGHPRLGRGPHSGRDAGRKPARRSLHLHGRRARYRLWPRGTLPGV